MFFLRKVGEMTSKDVILGLLLRKDLSGYEIKQLFSSVFARFFDASFGTIYPTLNKLVQEGSIQKKLVEQEGKPNKYLYSITPLGKKQFMEFLGTSIEPSKVRSDFVVRMFFSDIVDSQLVLCWIEEAIEHARENVKHLQSHLENFLLTEANPHPLKKIHLEMGVGSYQYQLQNLLETKSKIQAIIQQEQNRLEESP